MAGAFRQDDRMFWDRINKINGISLVVAEVYDNLRSRIIRKAKFAFRRPPVTRYSLPVTFIRMNSRDWWLLMQKCQFTAAKIPIALQIIFYIFGVYSND
jgi:hypothetical protein